MGLFNFFKRPKGYWVIKRAKNKQWYFVLKAPNNKTILTSETYHNRGDVFRGIASIRRNVNGKIKEDD